MPLVKNTETGNHYLVKINTDGDACSRTAIRSYDKQNGFEGADGNKVYTLPFLYEPASHTLWVYVNGQKAEYEPGSISAEQLLQYDETGVSEVTFHVGLENNDIIEFIVAGNYDGVGDGGIAPDLSAYLRHDGDINLPGGEFTGAEGPLSFMNNERIVNLVPGAAYKDAVTHDQVFESDGSSTVHKHSFLYDSDGTTTMVNTSNVAGVDVTNHKIINVADGVVANNSKDAMNGNRLYDHTVFGATASVLGHVKISVVSGVMTITS